jgi:hypothetical protein
MGVRLSLRKTLDASAALGFRELVRRSQLCTSGARFALQTTNAPRLALDIARGAARAPASASTRSPRYEGPVRNDVSQPGPADVGHHGSFTGGETASERGEAVASLATTFLSSESVAPPYCGNRGSTRRSLLPDRHCRLNSLRAWVTEEALFVNRCVVEHE